MKRWWSETCGGWVYELEDHEIVREDDVSPREAGLEIVVCAPDDEDEAEDFCERELTALAEGNQVS